MIPCPGLLAVIGLAVTVPAAATAQPADGIQVNSVVGYYDVEGSTWGEVVRSIEAKRPALPETDERWDGVTTWRYRLSAPTKSAANCAHAILVLEIEVAMPRLAEGYELSEVDQVRWALMERRLTAHEEGHVFIAHAGARRVLSSIRRAPCEFAAAIFETEIGRIRADQAQYDRLTRHGDNQEAWDEQGSE